MKDLKSSAQLRHNYWPLIEKIIGILLLIWSLIVLYNLFSSLTSAIRSDFTKKTKTGYGTMLLEYHLPVIVGIACLFGSWMLLMTDKTGWMLCVITSFAYGLTMFFSSRSKAVDHTLPMAQYYKSYGAAALIFFLIFIILLLKPIRQNFRPTLKTWLIIAAAVLIFIIDRAIINK